MQRTIIQSELNPAEREVAIRLMGELNDRFANDGCNDMELADTPANRALIESAECWNAGVDIADWRNHPDYHQIVVSNGNLIANNGLIAGYIRKRLEDGE